MPTNVARSTPRIKLKARTKYAAINRNLLNFPLARDARAKFEWRRSDKTGRWLCDLIDTETMNVRLSAPRNAPKQMLRAPSALDMNVLFLLLGTGRRTKSKLLKFSSRTQIAKALGMSDDSKNIQRVKLALDYWAAITIQFSDWYTPREKRSPEANHGPKSLPPPIASLTIARNKIEILLARDWSRLNFAGYFKNVDLPMPKTAPAQNLALLIRTSAADTRGYATLCRKMGIDHSEKQKTFLNAARDVKAYFEKHGGVLYAARFTEAMLREHGLDQKYPRSVVTFDVGDPKQRRHKKVNTRAVHETPRDESNRLWGKPKGLSMRDTWHRV